MTFITTIPLIARVILAQNNNKNDENLWPVLSKWFYYTWRTVIVPFLCAICSAGLIEREPAASVVAVVVFFCVRYWNQYWLYRYYNQILNNLENKK